MTNQYPLGKIIVKLQKAIACGGMTRETIRTAVEELSKLGYKYDVEQFPPLMNTESYVDRSNESPSSLAEALLWKLGKWKSYKRFASNYENQFAKPTKTDVVFFAFSKHLKDKKNPIYDQHAIRALWAICGSLSNEEKVKCRSILFDKKNKWKDSTSGRNVIECYEFFVRHINALVTKSDGATLSEIDRLLMPLGQAIKKSTSSYEEFRALSGWRGKD